MKTEYKMPDNWIKNEQNDEATVNDFILLIAVLAVNFMAGTFLN